MEETRHTHHYPAGRGGPIDTRPSLTHDHDRGLDGHDHDERSRLSSAGCWSSATTPA